MFAGKREHRVYTTIFSFIRMLHMLQMRRDFELILMYFISGKSGDSYGSVTLQLLLPMALFYVVDDLRRMRPSKFYSPSGFYPCGSDDSISKTGNITAINFSRSSDLGFLTSVE